LHLSKEKLKQVLVSLNPKDYSKTELQINCPECHHDECFISIVDENHRYGCFRLSKCGSKGNIYTLKKYGIKLDESEKVTKVTELFKKRSLKVFSNTQKALNLPLIKPPVSYKRVYDSEYLNLRGFKERDYDYWEVGRTSFGSLKDYVTFPIYQNSEMKAYVTRLARNKTHDKEPKYKNSISEFASLLGGFDQLTSNTETVILCEGIFDIINITRLLNLYDCNELKAICTFGAKVSENQINLLQQKGIQRIIMLFDGDVIKKIKPISFELNTKFDVQIGLLEGAINNQPEDAGNCLLTHLEAALNNLSSPLDFYLEKIEKKRL
jgi:hypothetical protein